MSKKILIYGGTGGIGQALAERLVEQGANVHLVARDGQRLRDLADRLGATFTQGDVEDQDTLDRASAEAGEQLAGLVFAVGTINLKPLSRLTNEDFLSDFSLNALAAAAAIRTSLKSLKASGDSASVVLFSTIAVAQGFASHASISMAKGAVEGLTRALAAELAPHIRVNAVAPSLTDTELASGMTGNDSMRKAIAQMHPIPRLGDPKDSAAAAAFLLSPEAGWITGQVLGVDGGRSVLRTRG